MKKHWQHLTHILAVSSALSFVFACDALRIHQKPDTQVPSDQTEFPTPQTPTPEQTKSVDPIPMVPSPEPGPAKPGVTPLPVQSGMRDVIVQLFNWPFGKITKEMAELSRLGYGQILVSPPNLSIASDQWWGRYQPVDYRLIAGPLGTQGEFQFMIQEAHRQGLRIIVDLVLNHTANESSALPPEAEQLKSKFGPLLTAEDYSVPFCITDYSDTYQVRNGRLCGGGGDKGLPDLNQNSERVLRVQREFVKSLNAMGVDGYRLDAVKHMEPSYFNKLLTDDLTKGKTIFGEIIADQATYDRDIGPYMTATSMAFYDFPLRATIQQAFAFGGSLATLLDPQLVPSKKALPYNRSVTFVMNHDIPNNESFRSMILDPVDEQLAYAYLLGRSEGVPYVFSDLGQAGGGGIRDDRWAYAHRSEILASMILFHNAVQGSLMQVLFKDDCRLIFQRDNKGLVGINKCGQAFSFPLPPSMLSGQKLIDLTNRQEVFQGGTLTLPARSAVMLLDKQALD